MHMANPTVGRVNIVDHDVPILPLTSRDGDLEFKDSSLMAGVGMDNPRSSPSFGRIYRPLACWLH